jgi:hypothetical protein
MNDRVVSDYLLSITHNVCVPYLPWWAAQGLGALREPRALPLLEAKVSDANRLMRHAGIRGLAHFKTRSSANVLLRRYEEEKFAPLRALLVHTLAEMATDPDRDPLSRIAPLVPPSTLNRLPGVRTLLNRRP